MRQVTEFSIGDVLRTALVVYAGNLPAFIPLAVVVFLPLFVLQAVDPLPVPPVSREDVDPAEIREFWWQLLKHTMLSGACATWLQAGVAHGTVRTLRGGSPDFWETISQSARILLVALLVALATTAITLAGVLLLIVPGVIFALMLLVAVPAAVVERRGIRAALIRSAQLTSGYKGHLFLMVAMLVGLSYIVGLLALTVFDPSSNPMLATVVDAFFTLLLSSIWASVLAVTYHDLRVLKDGADSQSIEASD